MALPLFLMGVFAIYSQNHEINDNTLQVQENLKVDFNQIVINEPTLINSNSTLTYNNGIYTLNNFTGSYAGLTYQTNYYVPSDIYVLLINFIDFDNHPTIKTSYPYDTAIEQIPLGRYATRGKGILTGQFTWSFRETNTTTYIKFNSFNVFNLTQMFGEGNEPSLNEFLTSFDSINYPYTLSQEMYIPSYTITYDDTDIMSQFMYVSYNALDKYLNFSQYQPFSAIYNWSQNTFFGGNAPMVFFIMFQMMCYWLVMSLFWLIFDVLLYVPSMIHKMIDKARLE